MYFGTGWIAHQVFGGHRSDNVEGLTIWSYKIKYSDTPPAK